VAVDGPPQIVYSFTLPYSRWKKDGVDINITSTKQSVVVDGEAMASKDDATVHLIYDGKEANLIVDATGKADEAKPIPVHGEKLDKADLLPKGARKLTLLPDAKTSVDDKTLFTVTITEIDPM
jgi:hypothetical protein